MVDSCYLALLLHSDLFGPYYEIQDEILNRMLSRQGLFYMYLPPFNTSGTSCAPSPLWLCRSHPKNTNLTKAFCIHVKNFHVRLYADLL